MPTSGAASPLPLIVGVAHPRGVKATLRDAATVRLPFGPLPPVANRPGSVSSLEGLDTPGPPVPVASRAKRRVRLVRVAIVVPSGRPISAAGGYLPPDPRATGPTLRSGPVIQVKHRGGVGIGTGWDRNSNVQVFQGHVAQERAR